MNLLLSLDELLTLQKAVKAFIASIEGAGSVVADEERLRLGYLDYLIARTVKDAQRATDWQWRRENGLLVKDQLGEV